jgi:hypothetical protein
MVRVQRLTADNSSMLLDILNIYYINSVPLVVILAVQRVEGQECMHGKAIQCAAVCGLSMGFTDLRICCST